MEDANEPRDTFLGSLRRALDWDLPDWDLPDRDLPDRDLPHSRSGAGADYSRLSELVATPISPSRESHLDR